MFASCSTFDNILLRYLFKKYQTNLERQGLRMMSFQKLWGASGTSHLSRGRSWLHCSWWNPGWSTCWRATEPAPIGHPAGEFWESRPPQKGEKTNSEEKIIASQLAYSQFTAKQKPKSFICRSPVSLPMKYSWRILCFISSYLINLLVSQSTTHATLKHSKPTGDQFYLQQIYCIVCTPHHVFVFKNLEIDIMNIGFMGCSQSSLPTAAVLLAGTDDCIETNQILSHEGGDVGKGGKINWTWIVWIWQWIK